MGEGEGDTVDHFQLVEQAVVLLAPLAIEELPFLACELEDVGSCAIVFACAHEVLGKVAAGEIPVCAEQVEAVQIAGWGFVGLWLDGEVGVA